ncbi:MAG: polysaccharide deacetylase family protein [candidate division KSB1 bacterium]|nr:polysaccharide deacetylase family protein [candidate division KSB1 bacterium]MDZ7303583.1 polysaccharide deacetylase family protein [candidate division KSB1 bacterium]MDZ7312826.1 polysaccharide deacetylase family protein [candidate division KSB1 bacterium]
MTTIRRIDAIFLIALRDHPWNPRHPCAQAFEMITTLLNKLRWSYRKNVPDLLALFHRNYPEFMFSREPKAVQDEIPVFVFHSVEPVTFEAQLKFLARNRYRTLGGEEFRAAIAGERNIPERSVLLTFDDGLATLWTVAYPLLRKYGFRAVSFIIPGCIPEQAPESPTYVEYEKNRVPVEALLARERGDFPLCSWQEIQEMHRSGVIDFQSHTKYHHLVCVSPQLVDFIHPQYDFYFFANINVPVYRVNGKLNFERQMPWGTPVYRAEPRMAGKPQYFDDEAARQACIEHVARNGDEQFFSRDDWRRQLIAVYQEARQHQRNSEFESPEMQAHMIYQDLQQARQIIENRLSGKTVDQLCYPWFMGSSLSVEQSRRAGYRVNYWGIVPQRKSNHAGDDLFYVPRIEDHYLFRLPGEGRKSLREILSAKMQANLPRFVNRLMLTNN